VNDKTEWIKTLKVGDEVAVDNSGRWYHNNYSVEKVLKITPTGRICLTDGKAYKPNGVEYGGENRRCNLLPVTQKIRDHIRRNTIYYKLQFNKLEPLLSIEQLETILTWQNELFDMQK
jgi:hypothetical protein